MNQAADHPHRGGLSAAEAARRLAADGPNELPSGRARGTLAIALHTLREPMFVLLLAAGGLYFLLGDISEAFILLGAIVFVLAITIVQERRTERVLEALRDMTSPRALVVRDGEQRRLPGREIVRGDLLVVAEGDRVAADAVLLSCGGIQTDESMLTGESVPVRKVRWDSVQSPAPPGGDDLPFIFAGTVLVKGQGLAEVTATGVRTEIGRIGGALRRIAPERTPLQREIGRLVRGVATLAFVLCALVVVLHGIGRGDWLDGLLAGITLAMALVPEEFPVVLTVFLALGAWRISQQRVLTRRIPAIEALGAASVLCVDKTGTLTENRMTVVRLVTLEDEFVVGAADRLPEPFHALLEFSILASEIQPYDPMERAFRRLGEHYLCGTEHLHDNWQIAHEYAISPGMLAMTHVWRGSEREAFVVATKGAPEAILDLCHAPDALAAHAREQVNRLAEQGLRVIGVARGLHREAHWPAHQHDFDFEYLGLMGLEDPLREHVPQAVDECRDAGIRVAMITGDYPGTARAVARRAGIDGERLMTGEELAGLSAAALGTRLRHTAVFARVMPEQKLALVEAYIRNGEVVAMTGDGVNDAPALRAAHVGIAMGARGTDVAREAAALVLIDDNFISIVRAVRLGRRIFDNLRKAISYIIAVHVPIAGISLVPLLVDWPLVLFPIHVVFLELIIDPACTLVFEDEVEEPDLMRRPPRAPDAPLIDRRALAFSLWQGASVLAAVLGVYALALAQPLAIEQARALAFLTMVVGNLGLIVENRSHSRGLWRNLTLPNRALWAVAGGTSLLLAASLALTPVQALFQFAWPGWLPLGGAIATGAASILLSSLPPRRWRA